MSSLLDFYLGVLHILVLFEAQTVPRAAALVYVQQDRLSPLSVHVYRSESLTDWCWEGLVKFQWSFLYRTHTNCSAANFLFTVALFSRMSHRSLLFCNSDCCPQPFHTGLYASELQMLLVKYFRLWLLFNLCTVFRGLSAFLTERVVDLTTAVSSLYIRGK